ncbi:hypothetical protein K438DRAFT_1963908 [Mycena galopus ATCC 62051]|nr:hypothetical protein K438DRAFT_1963908 [Mycena galopus ATCC 62051]
MRLHAEAECGDAEADADAEAEANAEAAEVDQTHLPAPLSEPAFLVFIVAYIINPQSILANLASMLLSNPTEFSAACATALSLHIDIIPEPTFPNSFDPSHLRKPQRPVCCTRTLSSRRTARSPSASFAY